MPDSFNSMPSPLLSPLHSEADRQADRRTLWMAALLIAASLVTQGMTEATEASRAGLGLSLAHVWTLEATSHGAILALVQGLRLVVDRAPLTAGAWRIAFASHVLACVAFSLIHVALMWSTRIALFPAIVGYEYEFDLLAPASLVYEFTKDAFTYILLICGFMANRAIERRGAEARAIRATDLAHGRLSLSSGGATIVLAVHEISHAVRPIKLGGL